MHGWSVTEDAYRINPSILQSSVENFDSFLSARIYYFFGVIIASCKDYASISIHGNLNILRNVVYFIKRLMKNKM